MRIERSRVRILRLEWIGFHAFAVLFIVSVSGDSENQHHHHEKKYSTKPHDEPIKLRHSSSHELQNSQLEGPVFNSQGDFPEDGPPPPPRRRRHQKQDETRHHHHHRLDEHPSDPPLQVDGWKDGCHGYEDGGKWMKECYSVLRSTMVRYSKILKEEENDTKVYNYDICGNMASVFSDCSTFLTNDVARKCVSRDKTIQRKMETFNVLLIHFVHLCLSNPKNEKQNHLSREIHACFIEEYRDTLSIRCDEYMEFNIRQGTKADCYFLRERFKCQESLLDSACGEQSTIFNHHFLLILSERQLIKTNCTITVDDNHFEVFKYDNKGCKKGLTKRLEWCTSIHLDGSFILDFHPDNDLVAMGNSKNIYKFCRAYDGFTKCIGPIKESCPKAVSLFLQYESKLHQYILKMDYICSKHVIEEYSINVKCLRSTITKHQLDTCEIHWSQFRPMLDSLTSVQFFCNTDQPDVIRMNSELAHLHSCHKDVITNHCGPRVGNIIVHFLQLALSDPLYLRFGYKPNCSLHGFESREIGDSINLSTESRLHLQYPFYDDDPDGFVTSGITEYDAEDYAIATSSPGHPETSVDLSKDESHTIMEDNATLMINSQTVGFYDRFDDTSTIGGNFGTNELEEIFFPVQTLPAHESPSSSSNGTPDSRYFPRSNSGFQLVDASSLSCFLICHYIICNNVVIISYVTMLLLHHM